MALRIVIRSRLRSRGFSRKSYAPFLIASTAVSMFPCPDIITTGVIVEISIIFWSTSSPSIFCILISQSTISYLFSEKSASPDGPSSARSTSYFSYSRTSLRVFRIALSSSMTKIFDMMFIFSLPDQAGGAAGKKAAQAYPLYFNHFQISFHDVFFPYISMPVL